MWTIVSRSLRVGTLPVLLLLVALLTTGCFFTDLLEVTIFDSEGDSIVSVSTTSTWLSCSNDDSSTYSCAYFNEEGISTFSLSGPGLLFSLLIYDPLVLQVPAGASDFQASYLDNAGGGGALVVTTGLSSIPVDATRTLQAEPGTQLVIIDFPGNAPASGSGGFNLNFSIPDDLATLDIKAVFTGKVTVEDATYYLPLYPCTSDMAALPTLNIPLPDGGAVNLPVDQVAGCDGETYSFAPVQNPFANTLLLPRLGK